MLAWRSQETLNNTLQALAVLPDDLFQDRVIFSQEISDEDRALAACFGFRAEGNQQNQGIREGIKQAVSCCQADIVLFLECDCLLCEPADMALPQLQAAVRAIAADAMKVVRLRHTRMPGEDYIGSKKFARYWPVSKLPGQGGGDSLIKRIRRLLRPTKATRLIGQAVVACEQADQRFPKWIGRREPNLYSLSSQVIPWTNQAIIVNRRWLLNTLIPYAEAHPTSRAVNGFPDLEKELNCRWWRQQRFSIGQAIPGLFTHYRLDRPDGDEKTLLHGNSCSN